MKIVTWNSQSKFAENFKEIKKQNADIYVIQECENPQITKSEEYRDFASNSIWVGDNKNYGLGIFAGDDVKLDLVGAVSGFDYRRAVDTIETNINEPATAKVRALQLYDLNGRRIVTAQKGIQIVKKMMSDGTVKTQKVIK